MPNAHAHDECCPRCGFAANPDKPVLDKDQGHLWWAGGHLKFTPMQTVILGALIDAWPRSLSLGYLHDATMFTWHDHTCPPQPEIIRVQICRIRKLLRDAEAPIQLPIARRWEKGYSISYVQPEPTVAQNA